MVPEIDPKWSPYEQAVRVPPESWEVAFTDAHPELKLISEKLNELGDYYPLPEDVFRAFRELPVERVRVVIVGQDPYPHSNGTKPSAVGMSFSVRRGDPVPGSLKNIYKEIRSDYPSFEIPDHGDLTGWVRQGVLLLNKCLTVSPGDSGSHRKLWMGFINKMIKFIVSRNPKVIFVMWGKNAQELSTILGEKVKQLTAGHPSPISARNGFFGCGHFREINELLLATYTKSIVPYLEGLLISVDEMRVDVENKGLKANHEVDAPIIGDPADRALVDDQLKSLEKLESTITFLIEQSQNGGYVRAHQYIVENIDRLDEIRNRHNWYLPDELFTSLEQAAGMEIDWSSL